MRCPSPTLVVDDDQAAGEAVQEMLRQAGAEVSAVRSAEEARRAVAELHPQLIVCDIAMPGENGYSFIRNLRQLDPARDAPRGWSPTRARETRGGHRHSETRLATVSFSLMHRYSSP